MGRRSNKTVALPARFGEWFESRGWAPHAHQIKIVQAAASGENTLLIAPTGAGKTLAGFLPTLIELADADPPDSLHTLYVSPLKALTVDIHRNLETPIEELGLEIRAETRTGDTPASKRQRQRRRPPHILLTTPESLALFLSYTDAARIFRHLRHVVVDELHALAGTKRGDLLALGLARLASLGRGCRFVGLSATVPDPENTRGYLAANGGSVRIITAPAGKKPKLEILNTGARLPWSGHMAVHAGAEIYQRLRDVRTAIVFVNTRAQAELIFNELWRLNDDNLPIAIHHGSLAVEQRRRVEAAMAKGVLRAVVATSSLDLGIDWGSVDLVIQVGAPKGSSRLIQRIGRANHRLDEPSRALLVPGNRFEVLECRAAVDAVRDMTLDGDPPQPGGLDVLAQHLIGAACSGPFDPDAMYEEVRRAAPYAELTRKDFDDTLGFVADGGYALGGYERYRRLLRDPEGRYKIASQVHARRYRMNVGTIVEAPKLYIKLARGRILGEVEEHFIQHLVPGDTFIFAGQLLAFERLRGMTAEVVRAAGDGPKVPAYQGGRLPLSTHLAGRVREMLADPAGWRGLPRSVTEWLDRQLERSVLPDKDGILIETFPRGGKYFLVAYCFEGRNAHQTLGMLLTRRMERAGFGPLGFVATDYVIAIWSLREPEEVDSLFALDMLGDDLEEWMAETSLMKRTFRNVAVIAGLIERRYPGAEKSRRQVTFNSDLIYDVLRQHEPTHILLRATRRDAGRNLIDLERLTDLLHRVQGRISHQKLDKVSPLAVPILLEIGKERVYGSADDDLLDEAAADLIEEATGTRPVVTAEEPAENRPPDQRRRAAG